MFEQIFWRRCNGLHGSQKIKQMLMFEVVGGRNRFQLQNLGLTGSAVKKQSEKTKANDVDFEKSKKKNKPRFCS